jgi:type III secretion system YscQ/HrcQ family protein
MNSNSQTEEIAADPFADDIFATNRKHFEETTPETIAPNELQWTRRLKKAAHAKIRWSALLAALPPDFSEKLPRHLSGALENLLTLPPEHGIELLPLVTKEINRAEDFPPVANHSWWLGVSVQQSEAEFAVEIDNAFAVWLVDAMLGEKVSEQIILRRLTDTETTVLEFLLLNLIYEANRSVQSPVFKIRSLAREMPARFANARANFAKGDSILAASWQIVHGLLPSIVRIYLSPETLKSLSAAENSLLNSAPRRAAWQRFQNHANDARARIALGQIELTLSELASLETGDVALIENNNLTIFGGNLFGSAEIFLGDGENLKVSGEILSPEAASPEAFEENDASVDNKILVKSFSANQKWKFVVTGLSEAENPLDFGQTMAETDENLSDETGAQDSGGNALAVENLALTLRVELEARRLTLAEIADLRENQILELGVSPTDSVNLLIENRVVGRGELVEIEERLGVRITKLMR